MCIFTYICYIAILFMFCWTISIIFVSIIHWFIKLSIRSDIIKDRLNKFSRRLTRSEKDSKASFNISFRCLWQEKCRKRVGVAYERRGEHRSYCYTEQPLYRVSHEDFQLWRDAGQECRPQKTERAPTEVTA